MTDRRQFCIGAAAVAASLSTPARLLAGEPRAQAPGARIFDIVMTVDLPRAATASRLFAPIPAFAGEGWQRVLSNDWKSNAAEAAQIRDPKSGASYLRLVFAPNEAQPSARIVSRVETRDRDRNAPLAGRVAPLSSAERKAHIAPTTLVPTDGIVKETSDRIVAGLVDEEAKARAIYEWVVENAFRDSATRGCGVGDIAAMLKSGYLGGKCADINALFVGLARAAGLPARDLYGLRVAPSRDYKSLGANSEVVTKAQHCRAEVYLSGKGWVAVDPADVRKVALEEPPGKLSLGDPKVSAARSRLFGSAEGNWIAYNAAQDVHLDGASAHPRLDFLMYPQAEVAGAALDCLDPDSFRYRLEAREVTA